MSKLYEYADENQKQLHTKFPNSHFLADPQNVDHLLLWTTFYRRNLHRFVMDYLHINLYLYQIIILYFMGISQIIVIIACRTAAKSFIVGLYKMSIGILYPSSECVVVSKTKDQAKVIIQDKIQDQIMGWSENARREVSKISNESGITKIILKSKSKIMAVVPKRGYRSTTLTREEFREMEKNTDDTIVSPYQHVRSAAYMMLPYYRNMPELREIPSDVYISSSWYDNGHWMWNLVDNTAKNMLDGKNQVVLAFDESIILKSGLKTKEQLIAEKQKLDPLSWRIEYLNERVVENSSAFFTYSMLTKNQRCEQPFYPFKKFVPKQDGEIRIVACDIAFVQNAKNDNSIFNCMRLIPENVSHTIGEDDVEISQGYRRIVPYIQSIQGGDTTMQALEIRRLYESFDADYIVLDTRNGGIAILDMLSKVMFDPERRVEYSPLKCMNNEGYANRIDSINSKAVIFAVNASVQLNSEIATEFRQSLIDEKIDLLVNFKTALNTILNENPEYTQAVSAEEQFEYEKPFLETGELINETSSLVYEKMQQTGVIKIHEQGTNRKDRYTSVSYGNHFANLLEKDLFTSASEYNFGVFVN